MDRAIRLLRILHHIQTRPTRERLTKAELADICRCSEKTIQRDIKLLRGEFGVDYDKSQGAFILPEGALPGLDLRLDLPDILALGLIAGIVRNVGFPQQSQILNALAKITKELSPRLQRLLDQATAAVTPSHLLQNYANAPVFPLLSAIRLRQTAEIDYDSASGGTRGLRLVDPYAVEPRDGIAWEMHGWCHKNRAFRTFALDNLYDVKILPTPYTYREAEWEIFQAQNVIGGLRGGGVLREVEVSFAPSVARYALRRRWPETLIVMAQADGTALLTGHIPDGNPLAAMVAEILRWRRGATVRGGQELLAAIKDELAVLTAKYS